MQKIMLIGNLCRDIEMAATQSGTTVARATLAVNGRKKMDGTQDTTFYRISFFGKNADTASRYMKKGTKISVIGDLRASTFQGNDGTTKMSLEVTTDSFELLPSRNENRDSASDLPAGTVVVEDEAMLNDLPF